MRKKPKQVSVANPAGYKTIILMRHGPVGHPIKKLTAQAPTDLQAVAEKFVCAKYLPDFIFYAPGERTKGSAEIVSDAFRKHNAALGEPIEHHELRLEADAKDGSGIGDFSAFLGGLSDVGRIVLAVCNEPYIKLAATSLAFPSVNQATETSIQKTLQAGQTVDSLAKAFSEVFSYIGTAHAFVFTSQAAKWNEVTVVTRRDGCGPSLNTRLVGMFGPAVSLKF